MFYSVVAAAILLVPKLSGALNCTKNEALGWFDPDNVYTCPDAKKCCMEVQLPSCCQNKPIEKEIIDQAILWGSVTGATVLIGILICVYRRDHGCCEGPGRCCCRRNKDTPDSKKYNNFPPSSPSDHGLTAKLIPPESKLPQLPGEIA